MTLHPYAVMIITDVLIILVLAHGLVGLEHALERHRTRSKRFFKFIGVILSALSMIGLNGLIFTVNAMALGH